jgi:hypothetical protein
MQRTVWVFRTLKTNRVPVLVNFPLYCALLISFFGALQGKEWCWIKTEPRCFNWYFLYIPVLSLDIVLQIIYCCTRRDMCFMLLFNSNVCSACFLTDGLPNSTCWCSWESFFAIYESSSTAILHTRPFTASRVFAVFLIFSAFYRHIRAVTSNLPAGAMSESLQEKGFGAMRHFTL